MNFLGSVLLASSDYTQIFAGLLAIFSMVVARLLDWYFPSKHHRKLDEETERNNKIDAVEEENDE